MDEIDRDTVEKLFLYYVGDTRETEFDPLLDIAISETEQLLRDDADRTDTRLPYLAAALALQQYRKMMAVRDRTIYTPTGTAAVTPSNSEMLEAAASLVREHMALCASLLKPISPLLSI